MSVDLTKVLSVVAGAGEKLGTFVGGCLGLNAWRKPAKKDEKVTLNITVTLFDMPEENVRSMKGKPKRSPGKGEVVLPTYVESNKVCLFTLVHILNNVEKYEAELQEKLAALNPKSKAEGGDVYVVGQDEE